MTEETHPKYECDGCGTSLSKPHELLPHNGKLRCIECHIKALDPEGLMTKTGQSCQRCGASLDQAGKALTPAGEMICLSCAGKDMAADWNGRKLPGGPEKCERCDASLAGNDVAMLWLGKVICGGCFDEVRKAHPEVTRFELIPLVDMKWTGLPGGGTDLMLDLMPATADVRQDEDGFPDSPNEHIN
jgi:formylmethanofuran dehydrogenase subunit E